MAVVGSWRPTGNDQQRLTLLLRQAVQQLGAAAALFAQLANIQAQMLAGGVVYTDIETYFSLLPGTGADVKNVVGTAATALAGGDIQGAIQRLG